MSSGTESTEAIHGVGWKRVRHFLVLVAVWTVPALCFALQNVVQGSEPSVWAAFLKTSYFSYLWVPLTPVVFWLGRRVPITGERRFRATLFHSAVSTALALAFPVVMIEVSRRVGVAMMSEISFADAYRQSVFGILVIELTIYWGVLGVGTMLDTARTLREETLRAVRMETELAHARLTALQSQLQPHFLFNTLHAISALMHRDVDAADRMLVRLSDLLRLTIDKIGVHEVSLKEELEFLRSYLEIEKTRFQDRLSVDLQIDPTALDARVPNLILQPLVENSIRHGLAPRSTPGHIEVRAEREDGKLRLTVSDDGPGLPDGPDNWRKQGLGLANVQARLTQLYGADHQLALKNRPEGGLAVTLTIPFRVGSAPGDNDSAASEAGEP